MLYLNIRLLNILNFVCNFWTVWHPSILTLNMLQFDRITSELLYNTPLVHWTHMPLPQYGAFNKKALARYQVILLGEQRHIRCEQLAQSCCPNNAAAGVEPVTYRSPVQRPTTTPPSHSCQGP